MATDINVSSYFTLFCRNSNIFYNSGTAIHIHGGSDNRIENNIVYGCEYCFYINPVLNSDFIKNYLIPLLKSMPYKSYKWEKEYPELTNILANNPTKSKNNIIRRNIFYKSEFSNYKIVGDSMFIVQNNLKDIDPKFYNAEQLDFRLKNDSPAKNINFKNIAIRNIGVLKKGCN
ncbi:MAG: hypothetical protein M1480_11400 [Bacteroidetes bacterium]|nr:hypothetical protein [Bacteroidota bacterium]